MENFIQILIEKQTIVILKISRLLFLKCQILIHFFRYFEIVHFWKYLTFYMPDTFFRKSADRLGEGTKPNFRFSRIWTLNSHNFTNFYSIHKPYMWDTVYIDVYLYWSARVDARAPCARRIFEWKFFFEDFRTSDVASPHYFHEFLKLVQFLILIFKTSR